MVTGEVFLLVGDNPRHGDGRQNEDENLPTVQHYAA